MGKTQVTLPLAQALVIDITGPKGWLELNSRALRQFREFAYLCVWRDIEVRYKPTAIGAA